MAMSLFCRARIAFSPHDGRKCRHRHRVGEAMVANYSDLAGKVVRVTGGASGIGEAIVRRFARQKSTVVFFDIADEAGISLARELSNQGLAAHFAHVDVTDTPE